MRTAIELRAARLGSDAPSEEFLSGLQRRLAAELDDEPAAVHPIGGPATGYRRRNLLIGTSAAAAAATVGAVVDRTLIGHGQPDAPPAAKQAPCPPIPARGWPSPAPRISPRARRSPSTSAR